MTNYIWGKISALTQVSARSASTTFSRPRVRSCIGPEQLQAQGIVKPVLDLPREIGDLQLALDHLKEDRCYLFEGELIEPPLPKKGRRSPVED